MDHAPRNTNEPSKLENAHQNAKAEVKHVVILVHGIRDFGTRWMNEIKKSFSRHEILVEGTHYGYFDVFRFLSPLDHSKRPRKIIAQRIDEAIRAHTLDGRVPHVSVICHSFGTHLVTQLLKTNSNVRLHRLILCGSVVKETFDWSRIADQIGDKHNDDKSRFIINDCAEKDPWPALAKAAGWRFGKGGVDGFRNPFVTDRWHEGNHSVFLNAHWAEKHWLPILLGRNLASDETLRYGEGTPESLPTWIRLLAAIPLNWLILLCTTTLILVAFQFLSSRSPTRGQGIVSAVERVVASSNLSETEQLKSLRALRLGYSFEQNGLHRMALSQYQFLYDSLPCDETEALCRRNRLKINSEEH